MRISILTVVPEMFDSFLSTPIIKRAFAKNICEIEVVDIKSFADGCFRAIDDSPFGGGPGMVMRCQPIVDAIRSVETSVSNKILLSPKGKKYDQKKAHLLSQLDHIILVCGRYEGVDARVEDYVDEQISIGDYILTGGELGAEIIVDSVIRLLDGILRDGATLEESHENGLLEYPQYTRPAEFEGRAVPKILLSGNRQKIEDWRLQQSLMATRTLRPDMFCKLELTEREKKLIKEFDKENQ